MYGKDTHHKLFGLCVIVSFLASHGSSSVESECPRGQGDTLSDGESLHLLQRLAQTLSNEKPNNRNGSSAHSHNGSSAEGDSGMAQNQSAARINSSALEANASEGSGLSAEALAAINEAVERAAATQEEMLMESLGQKMEDLVKAELELEQPPPMKSKTVLALLEMFGLGLFGIDRCYMGQTCLGIAKGLTLGGLFVWMLIDYFVILVNLLASWDSISAIGYHAQFYPDSVHSAFLITVIMLVVKCCCFSCGSVCAPKVVRADDLMSESQVDGTQESASK